MASLDESRSQGTQSFHVVRRACKCHFCKRGLHNQSVRHRLKGNNDNNNNSSSSSNSNSNSNSNNTNNNNTNNTNNTSNTNSSSNNNNNSSSSSNSSNSNSNTNNTNNSNNSNNSSNNNNNNRAPEITGLIKLTLRGTGVAIVTLVAAVDDDGLGLMTSLHVAGPGCRCQEQQGRTMSNH